MSEEEEIAAKINQLNEKQMAAFSIVKNFIDEVTFISLPQKKIISFWLKYTFTVPIFFNFKCACYSCLYNYLEMKLNA